MKISYHCVCGATLNVEGDPFAESTDKVVVLVDEFKQQHAQCLSKTWEERDFYRNRPITGVAGEAIEE
jgi:hypothetical protein